MKSLYSVLEVREDANLEEIKKAYRRLMQRYHPDMCPDSEFAARMARQINRAYGVLSEPELRRRYDAKLQHARNRSRSSTPNAADAKQANPAQAEQPAAAQASQPKQSKPNAPQHHRQWLSFFAIWLFVAISVVSIAFAILVVLRTNDNALGKSQTISQTLTDPNAAHVTPQIVSADWKTDAKPSVVVQEPEIEDVGVIAGRTTLEIHPIEPFRDGARTATIDIPRGAELVEIGFVSSVDALNATRYPGYVGSLIVNNRLAVVFHWRYTANKLSHGLALDFRGHQVNTRVPESIEGMLDVTELVELGKPCVIAFSHKQSSLRGVRVRITTRVGSAL